MIRIHHYLILSLLLSSIEASRTAQGVLIAGDYLCKSTGPCQPCTSTTQSSKEVCRIWGNRRPLECIPRRNRLDPIEVQDPDAKSSSSSTSTSTTTTTREDETPPSTFYEFEPTSPSRNNRNQGPDEEWYEASGEITKEGYSSSDQLDGVVVVEGGGNDESRRIKEEEAEEELRNALDQERRRRKRSINIDEGEGEEEEEIEIAKGVWMTKRQGDQTASHGVTTTSLTIEAYEACPKVVKQEQSDYFEFVLCNLFFALASLSVLLYRQRTLAGRQMGNLVARIMKTETEIR